MSDTVNKPNRPFKGCAIILIKDIANPKQKRSSKVKFPINFKGQIFLANGLTVGVTEAQITEFAACTKSYYEVKVQKFYPTLSAARKGYASEDYAVEYVLDLIDILGAADFKIFTKDDTRPEIIEMRQRDVEEETEE